MTAIKFRHGERYAEADKATFNAWECGLISGSEAIYMIAQNNGLSKIPYSVFKQAAEELGYRRGRKLTEYDEGE